MVSGQLLGAVVGGFLALGGSLGTLLVQQLMRQRGVVVCEARPWELTLGRGGAATVPKSLSEEDFEDFDFYPHYSTAMRIHNQKDVSVGLMELYISVYAGQEKLMELRPNAQVRYMTVQDVQRQSPFEAATLPAQEVVVIWLNGGIFDIDDPEQDPDKVAKFRECTRVDLGARLSNERSPRRLQLARYD